MKCGVGLRDNRLGGDVQQACDLGRVLDGWDGVSGLYTPTGRAKKDDWELTD